MYLFLWFSLLLYAIEWCHNLDVDIMVSGYSKELVIMSGTELEEPGQLKRAVIDASAGAVAGAISRMVTSPLDVIKIRFQVRKILDSLAFCGSQE